VRLEWSAFAIEDRDGIFDYIEEDSPHAAVVVDDRIRMQVRQLLQFPETGRPGRIEGTRELVISQTPYIAALSRHRRYRAHPARVARRAAMA
jgi:toxin ParE1/3/4